jgi:hypothetical protein
VLPEHVAACVAALASDEFSHTTGTLVPVDGGVAAAFVRWRDGAPVFAAVDLGVSRRRRPVDGDQVELDLVHRFDNGMYERDGHLRWSIGGLYEQVLDGLRESPIATPMSSRSASTPEVDYRLLDADGHLLAEPVAYRDGYDVRLVDASTSVGVDVLSRPRASSSCRSTRSTGSQPNLAARSGALPAVLIPDLLAFAHGCAGHGIHERDHDRPRRGASRWGESSRRSGVTSASGVPTAARGCTLPTWQSYMRW